MRAMLIAPSVFPNFSILIMLDGIRLAQVGQQIRAGELLGLAPQRQGDEHLLVRLDLSTGLLVVRDRLGEVAKIEGSVVVVVLVHLENFQQEHLP